MYFRCGAVSKKVLRVPSAGVCGFRSRRPGTETVLAVGPGEVSSVDAITGRLLRLLR